jgi:hypothetical protein
MATKQAMRIPIITMYFSTRESASSRGARGSEVAD